MREGSKEREKSREVGMALAKERETHIGREVCVEGKRSVEGTYGGREGSKWRKIRRGKEREGGN